LTRLRHIAKAGLIETFHEPGGGRERRDFFRARRAEAGGQRQTFLGHSQRVRRINQDFAAQVAAVFDSLPERAGGTFSVLLHSNGEIEVIRAFS
jgi:hypothetical protein